MMKNALQQTTQKWRSMAVGIATALSFCAVTAQTLTVSAAPQGADFAISGSCVTGNGKPVLELTPIQLAKPTYNGPKKYQTTWVTHDPISKLPKYFTVQSSAQAVPTGPANQGCGHSGSRGMYQMLKADWAKGTWQIKLLQGANQSPPVIVNM
jgi:hypothetical protein